MGARMPCLILALLTVYTVYIYTQEPMSNSALGVLQTANALYRKELEQIDAVSVSAAGGRRTPRLPQACGVQRVA
jgi:hypothetical protein